MMREARGVEEKARNGVGTLLAIYGGQHLCSWWCWGGVQLIAEGIMKQCSFRLDTESCSHSS